MDFVEHKHLIHKGADGWVGFFQGIVVFPGRLYISYN